MWSTPLIGPLLWFTFSLLPLAKNEGKDLQSFHSFQNRLLVHQGGKTGLQTLELLHRPNRKLGNPDLTHKVRGTNMHPHTHTSPSLPSSDPALSDLATPTLPHAVRISAREELGQRQGTDVELCSCSGQKAASRCFPSSPPLVNSQPLPNCRDHCLKLEAHATCTAD